MKDIGVLVLLMILLCSSCIAMGSLLSKKMAKGHRIQAQSLPDRALELLSGLCHGMGASPDFYRYKKKYYAVFHNGEVWFDEEGELIKAKYYFTQLPELIRRRVPDGILNTVARNFPETYVSGFERTDDGYTLFVFGKTDGELFFDGEGNLRLADDAAVTGDCQISYQRLPEHAIGY